MAVLNSRDSPGKYGFKIGLLKLLPYTVPLNYNFTFTHISTRGSHGKGQKLP